MPVKHLTLSGFHQLTVMPTTSFVPEADIDPSNIPYRMFSDYLLQILFPKVDKVKMAQSLNVSPHSVNYQFSKFLLLIFEKSYILQSATIFKKSRILPALQWCHAPRAQLRLNSKTRG